MPVVAGWKDEPLGQTLVFRLWPARSLHVVGDSPLAAEFRWLIAVVIGNIPDVPDPGRELIFHHLAAVNRDEGGFAL